MKAKNILINGVSLDTILRHYNNIQILGQYVIKNKWSGGYEVLKEWDEKRSIPIEKDIKIEIV
jgi:hypothetical protein